MKFTFSCKSSEAQCEQDVSLFTRLPFESHRLHILAWVVFLKSIGKAFDADFKINLAHVSRCKLIFDEEVTLAHRSRVESTSERIEIMVRGVSNDIVTHATHNKSHEARSKFLEPWNLSAMKNLTRNSNSGRTFEVAGRN